jgi:hypothetical protein
MVLFQQAPLQCSKSSTKKRAGNRYKGVYKSMNGGLIVPNFVNYYSHAIPSNRIRNPKQPKHGIFLFFSLCRTCSLGSTGTLFTPKHGTHMVENVPLTGSSPACSFARASTMCDLGGVVVMCRLPFNARFWASVLLRYFSSLSFPPICLNHHQAPATKLTNS